MITPTTMQMNTTASSSEGLEEMSGIMSKLESKSPTSSRLVKKFSSKRFSKKTLSVERSEGNSTGKRTPSQENKSVERDGTLRVIVDKVKMQKTSPDVTEEGSPRANTAPKKLRSSAKSPLSNKLSPKPLNGVKPGTVQSNSRMPTNSAKDLSKNIPNFYIFNLLMKIIKKLL
jgi:hypothetical protein